MPGNLDSLAFDLADQVASFAIPPHPAIWGERAGPQELHAILAAAPPAFGGLLLACHLLWPERTPAWARPFLEACCTSLWQEKLTALESAPWRLAHVPTIGPFGPTVAYILVGFAPRPLTAAQVWDDASSRQAAATLAQLIHLRCGHAPSLIPLTASGRISGTSFGLPCYLAARAAFLHIPNDTVLATGAVDPAGNVLPVADVLAKAQIADRIFLYPSACAYITLPLGVRIATVDEAEAVLRWAAAPHEATRLITLERLLNGTLPSQTAVAEELSRIPEALAPWVRHQRDRIAQALSQAPDLPALINALPQAPAPVREAILHCLNPSIARKRPDIAWDLALLQMEQANHRGDTAQAEVWRSLTVHHEARICRLDDGPRHILLREIIQTISRLHNRYEFPLPLPLTPSGREALEELEAQWQRRRQRLGESACIILGQYYGTVGQHYGFLGPDYLQECLAALATAQAAFCAPCTGRINDVDRDILYEIFARSAAGDHRAALELWEELEGRCGPVEQLNPYQLHALLRLHREAGRPLSPTTLGTIVQRIEKEGGPRHPWQLVAYNAAAFLPTPQATVLLERAHIWCCQQGPTVQVMALLPLAALAQLGHPVPPEAVYAALAPVRQGLLHEAHFAPLTVLDTEDVLIRVAQRPERFFPYTYH